MEVRHLRRVAGAKSSYRSTSGNNGRSARGYALARCRCRARVIRRPESNSWDRPRTMSKGGKNGARRLCTGHPPGSCVDDEVQTARDETLDADMQRTSPSKRPKLA